MSAKDLRIAVTGIGIVAPGALGVGAFSQFLREGRTAVAPVTRFDTSALSSHKAALVDGFNPKDFIAPMKIRRLSTLSRFALAAARLAIDDGAFAGSYESEVVGVAMGSAFGPVQTSIDYLDEYLAKGPSLAPPQLFAESVANAPGSHVAIEHGFRGFNLTFTQKESSALGAVMFAASQLAKGTVHAAIAGGIEELNEVTFGVLDRIGALSRADDRGEESARPFDRDRNGIVLGEGGAALILERNPVARASRRAYAYLSGFGIARDTTATISDWGESVVAIRQAMLNALGDAGLGISDIDVIWASANSSLRGDRIEWEAIQSLFEDSSPLVVATKGYFGEYAAAGALQIASAVLAIDEQRVPKSVGFNRGDDGMNLTLSAESCERNIRHLLLNSISAGGGVISAVISRSDV